MLVDLHPQILVHCLETLSDSEISGNTPRPSNLNARRTQGTTHNSGSTFFLKSKSYQGLQDIYLKVRRQNVKIDPEFATLSFPLGSARTINYLWELLFLAKRLKIAVHFIIGTVLPETVISSPFTSQKSWQATQHVINICDGFKCRIRFAPWLGVCLDSLFY